MNASIRGVFVGRQRRFFSLFLAVLGALTVSASGRAGAADQKTDQADFSGKWALNEQLSDDPVDKARQAGLVGKEARGERTPGPGGGESGGRGRGRRGGSGGGQVGSEITALPWELLEDDRRLVIEDHGQTVRITRGQDRQRTLFADGEERELDDGDGSAKVIAKRKGAKGERIVVSVKWSTGRERGETWEILSNPSRLVVTTKVKDRRSISFKRVYEPAPDEPAETALAPTPAPPSPVPAGPTPPAASTVAGMSQCQIRPPRGTAQDELSRMAKISQADAENRATAFVAPRRPSSVISSDVDVEEGCLVWSFVLRFSDKPKVLEVGIDAGDGKVLSSESQE